MSRMYRFVVFVFVIVLLALLFLFLGFSVKQFAVEKAILACGSFHSSQQETPRNIKVKLLTCENVETETQGILCWSASMDGSWLVQGPLEGDTPGMSIPLSHCDVIFDAVTGVEYKTHLIK